MKSKHGAALKKRPACVRRSKRNFALRLPNALRLKKKLDAWPKRQRRKLRHRRMFLNLSVVRPRSSLNQPRNLTITLALDTTTELSSNPSAFRTKVSQVKKFRRLHLTLSQAISLRNEQPR